MKNNQSRKREAIKIPSQEKVNSIVRKASTDSIARTTPGELKSSEEIAVKEKERALADAERLEHMMIKERATIAGIRISGLSIIERGIKYVDSCKENCLVELMSSPEGGRIMTFLKNTSELIQKLPAIETTQTVEIRKKFESMGDDELSKRLVEIETTLRQKGVKVG